MALSAQAIASLADAEIGFVLCRALHGPGCTVDDVLDATGYLVAAVEIADSRYADFMFDVSSVIADNTSAARYVVRHAPRRDR